MVFILWEQKFAAIINDTQPPAKYCLVIKTVHIFAQPRIVKRVRLSPWRLAVIWVTIAFLSLSWKMTPRVLVDITQLDV